PAPGPRPSSRRPHPLPPETPSAGRSPAPASSTPPAAQSSSSKHKTEPPPSLETQPSECSNSLSASNAIPSVPPKPSPSPPATAQCLCPSACLLSALHDGSLPLLHRVTHSQKPLRFRRVSAPLRGKISPYPNATDTSSSTVPCALDGRNLHCSRFS